MDEEFVKNFNKLINDLIKTHLNDEHFLDHMDSWHNCFKYHNHINEILVDRFVDRMT